MKAETLINSIDSKYPNTVETQDKLDWISELELTLFSNVIKELHEKEIDIVPSQEMYSLGDIKYEDVELVMVDTTPYTPMDLLFHKPYSFYKKNGMLALDPIPTLEKKIYIIHRYKPIRINVSNMTTRELLLPEEYEKLYHYYVYHNICLLNKDFGESNNWIQLYNDLLNSFSIWYNKNRTSSKTFKTDFKWRY